MDICYVAGSSLNTVWQDRTEEVLNQDVIVFGFNGLGLVSYKKELSGESEYFSDLARFSKQVSSVVISGCDTDTYGVFRHSAVVADNGKILGVSDAVYSVGDSEYSSGGGFRVFDTSAGRIGIVVAEDLYFTESVKVLTMCEADIIISIFKKVENAMPQTVLRATSFMNGINMGLCANEYMIACDNRGKVIASGKDIVKVKTAIIKEYSLINTKRRSPFGNTERE